MADAQGVPVFIRNVYDAQGRFIGRFAPEQIAPLVALVREWGFFDKEDMLDDPMGQFVGYEDDRGKDYVGFEIIMDKRA